MGHFNDQMKTMTMQIRVCGTERRDALGLIYQDTDRVLENARTFVSQVSADHQAMADQLHENLSDQRTALHDQVQDMRRHNQEGLQQMGDDLRERLGKEKRHLKKEVGLLLRRCSKSRHHLAEDLRHASLTWQKFAKR
ncbi:MAG: hypothetical protein P4L84_27825 [Isosphaeraceae bacterium]|nr:hypothetical protein [Isosphaeraceae bacterium]